MGDTKPKILWEHPNPERTNLYKFKQMVEKKRKLNLPTFEHLHEYSITQRPSFWADCWAASGLIHAGTARHTVNPSARIDASPVWFPGVSLNFAENILYTRSSSSASERSTRFKEDNKIALVAIRENGTPKEVTWGQLRERVALFASALKAHGVKKGDRVAVVANNTVDTLCVFLGSTALGALFSSSSADMGVKGVMERLRQIRPGWVFIDEELGYNGKIVRLDGTIRGVVEGMRGVDGFKGVVTMPRGATTGLEKISEAVVSLQAFLDKGNTAEVAFEKVAFGDGFLIVYSSGTTGPPKCIVHAVGGVLLSAFKEGSLHREFCEESVALQFTTTGWIMYLSSVQSLFFGAKLIMYDGSPFYPRVDSFLRLAGDHRVTHFGVSPRYLATLQSAGVIPHRATDLSSLEVVTSTGMPLPVSLYQWFYSSSGFPPRAHLANISGGTDIAGAFGDCNALMPVYESGGCQGPSLGMDVRVYDSTTEGREGKEVPHGEPGELVCTKAFPNQPTSFYGDIGNAKYHAAYFARFDNVWTHGDFIMRDPVTHAFIFLGRADGVLNPSGVRFGSAEIYSVLETEFKDVEDSVCVGQRREKDDDESVLLFLKMRPGKQFTPALVADIKTAIAKALSRRHVPKYVFETPEIPATVNGKKVELPVKQIVSGRAITPSGTLANPDSLKFYEKFVKVEQLESGKERSKL